MEESPCGICKKDDNDIFFLTNLPCSHQVCLSCISQIRDMRCPFCREDFGEKLKVVCPKVSFSHQIRRSIWDEPPSALDQIVEYQSPRNSEERISSDMFNSDFSHFGIWNGNFGADY